MEIEGTLPGSDNIDLTSSCLPGVSQTSGYLHQGAVQANVKTNMEMGKEMIRRDKMSSMSGKEGLEQLSQTTGLTITLGR